MGSVVFAGPTLTASDRLTHPDVEIRPPERQGDVYRAVVEGVSAIGIVDGRWRDTPAVWHKEILWALANDVRVYGSASMGAIRAAELAPFGMEGVGTVYELFASGDIEDGDEVAVAHADQGANYQPSSVALVDLRATVQAAVAAGVLTPSTGNLLVGLAKETFWPDRSYGDLVSRLEAATGRRYQRLRDFIDHQAVELKRNDALAMLDVMDSHQDNPDLRRTPAATFTFMHTQFFDRLRRPSTVGVWTRACQACTLEYGTPTGLFQELVSPFAAGGSRLPSLPLGRTTGLGGSSGVGCSRRHVLAELPSVPSSVPRSRATRAIGSPVSVASASAVSSRRR